MANEKCLTNTKKFIIHKIFRTRCRKRGHLNFNPFRWKVLLLLKCGKFLMTPEFTNKCVWIEVKSFLHIYIMAEKYKKFWVPVCSLELKLSLRGMQTPLLKALKFECTNNKYKEGKIGLEFIFEYFYFRKVLMVIFALFNLRTLRLILFSSSM